MKIAILGAGAMGSVYGARLTFGGADVVLLDVNEDHLNAIKSHGLKVALDDGDHLVNIRAMRPEAFDEPADLILLFTKTFHTTQALEAIKSHLPTTPILSLQNGLGIADKIFQFAPPENVLIGMTMTPAEWLGPGSVASHGPAATSLYTANGSHHPILDDIVKVMTAGGIDVQLNRDIQAAIWEKAAFNCALNGISALSNATPGSIGASAVGRELADQIVSEVIAVAISCGVNADLEKVRALLRHAFESHRHHEPSMLQDIKAGRQTEVLALNLAAAKIGQANGVDTPTNRAVGQLVQIAEDSLQWSRSNSAM